MGVRIRNSNFSLSGVEDVLKENADLQRRVAQLERQLAAGAGAAPAAVAAAGQQAQAVSAGGVERAGSGSEDLAAVQGLREHTQVGRSCL